jgi:hypothetical protein
MSSVDDQLLKRLSLTNWRVLAVMLVASLFWRSMPVSLGVLAGGLLVILNYGWMAHSLLKVMRAPHSGSARGFKRNYFFRLLVVGAALYLLLARGLVHPLALVVGLSVVVVSLLITTMKRLY